MSTSLPRLAFAGIGLMGLPMGKRLLAAGYPLTVWNRNPEKCAEMGETARRIGEEQFDRPRSYKKIIGMVDSVLGVKREL